MADPQYQPNLDIIIPQGATWRQRYRYFYTDPDTKEKIGIDVSDMTPQGQVRAKKAKDAAKYAEMSFDMAEAADGYVTASMSATITETIPKSGFYDIELHGQGQDPEVIRLAQGHAYIDTEVTA